METTMTKAKAPKKAKLVKCACGKGVQIEEREDGYYLCCEPCGVRVAGPFADGNEIPAYKPVAGYDSRR